MLVLVKEPRIKIDVIEGLDKVVTTLKSRFKEVTVVNDEGDELIEIMETDWFKAKAAEMHPGRTLRVYRDNAGLTQKQLAEKCHIPQSHISAMELGKRPIGKISAKRLAHALRCDYRRLL